MLSLFNNSNEYSFLQYINGENVLYSRKRLGNNYLFIKLIEFKIFNIYNKLIFYIILILLFLNNNQVPVLAIYTQICISVNTFYYSIDIIMLIWTIIMNLIHFTYLILIKWLIFIYCALYNVIYLSSEININEFCKFLSENCALNVPTSYKDIIFINGIFHYTILYIWSRYFFNIVFIP